MFSFLIFSSLAYSAETITQQAKLNFGVIALKDNLAAYQFRILFNGQIIKDPEIITITPGTPAKYFVAGYPPNTLLTISVTSVSTNVNAPSSPNPSNQDFVISNFDYLPLVTSDINGEITILVGATITTSGAGSYSDNIYATTMNISVTYP